MFDRLTTVAVERQETVNTLAKAIDVEVLYPRCSGLEVHQANVAVRSLRP